MIRPQPSPRNIIPIVKPAGPVIWKPDFKAAAQWHGFVFDQSNWHPGILPTGGTRGNGHSALEIRKVSKIEQRQGAECARLATDVAGRHLRRL
jgi:hypothetical protein